MGKDADKTGRRLTHDELKAMEAAFQGRSFQEVWTQAARTVYDGILAAKMKLNHESFMHGLPAPNRAPQGVEELVGASVPCGSDEDSMVNEVMQRIPSLVRCKAIGKAVRAEDSFWLGSPAPADR